MKVESKLYGAINKMGKGIIKERREESYRLLNQVINEMAHELNNKE